MFVQYWRWWCSLSICDWYICCENKREKKTSTTKLSWTIYNGFRHSKDYKKFESFRHLTEVNSLTFFSLFFQRYLGNGMLKRNFLIKCSPSFLHDNVKSRTNLISIRNIRSNLVVWIRRKLTNRYIFNQVFHWKHMYEYIFRFFF